MSTAVGIRDVVYCRGVKIMTPSNLYGCVLGENVFVGPFVEIQKNVTIGDNVKVQSHIYFEYVKIGRNCFIGHGVMFTNDKFTDGSPARGDKTKYAETTIAERVYIEVAQIFIGEYLFRCGNWGWFCCNQRYS